MGNRGVLGSSRGLLGEHKGGATTFAPPCTGTAVISPDRVLPSRETGSCGSECQGSHLHPDFVEGTLALALIEVVARR